jgi:hypothetical protein
MSAEKYVKHALKLIAKVNGVDYEKLKISVKKVIKEARNHDQRQLGLMEELLDLTNNVSCLEDLDEYDMEVLNIYCQIKDIDQSGTEKAIKARVWENFEEEYGDSEEDSIESESSEPEDESEVEVEIVSKKPKPVVIMKKKEAKVVFEPVNNS